MTEKLLHIKETDFDLILGLNSISYVRRTENITWIHFHGDREMLTLKGEAAKAFWNHIKGYAPTIYEPTNENKNAETHTS